MAIYTDKYVIQAFRHNLIVSIGRGVASNNNNGTASVVNLTMQFVDGLMDKEYPGWREYLGETKDIKDATA